MRMSATMSECDARAWLRSLQRFGMRPGLERISKLLELLGQPHRGLAFFHVAGTNGKGSVCAFLTALLGEQGRVGTFVSPAFDGYRGRFSVAGERIDEPTFIRLAERVREAALRMVEAGLESPTEFEALTAMALLYFQEQRPDFVVWETGLGGRYDSTNVVMPAVCAITNVGWDHVEILGPTLAHIAYDKAGIIKPGIPVITGADDTAYSVIAEVARAQRAPLFRLGSHFAAVRESEGLLPQRMTYRGLVGDVHGLHIPLFGAHQCLNAAIAIAMVEAAAQRGVCRRPEAEEIRRGVAKCVWPGRFEVRRQRGRWVVLDGAHNPDGARAFAAALREFGRARGIEQWTMVLGILSDKDVIPMLDAVLPLASRVGVAAPDTPRAINPRALANLIRVRAPGLHVTVHQTVADAVAWATEHDAPTAVWGSLYTVEEARQAMDHNG